MMPRQPRLEAPAILHTQNSNNPVAPCPAVSLAEKTFDKHDCLFPCIQSHTFPGRIFVLHHQCLHQRKATNGWECSGLWQSFRYGSSTGRSKYAHAVWQRIETKGAKQNGNTTGKKQANNVAAKNNAIETGIIELDILIELFHKRVLHGRILSWKLCFRKPHLKGETMKNQVSIRGQKQGANRQDGELNDKPGQFPDV